MSFWQNIEKPIIGLSPMDGVTDASFRFIAAKHGGPDVILTEFVSVDAAAFAPHSLLKDLAYSEIERPIVAQIYGHAPDAFYRAAHIVCALGFDGLDINMGCPAKKVAAKGSGAGLILTPELARAIIRAARRGIRDWFEGQTLSALSVAPEFVREIDVANRRRTGTATPPARRLIPVSVKTRIGYEDIVVEDWIGNLFAGKPAAISIHGRTLKQQYRGSADWDAIARAVRAAKGSGTLILGNGDLRSMQDVYRRVGETGVDGALIGRSTQGNPWIFKAQGRVKEALRSTGEAAIHEPPVGLDERFRVALEHAGNFTGHRGDASFVALRKHLAWYCHSSPGAAQLRSQMVRVNGLDEVVECLRKYTAALAGAPETMARVFSEHESSTGLSI